MLLYTLKNCARSNIHIASPNRGKAYNCSDKKERSSLSEIRQMVIRGKIGRELLGYVTLLLRFANRPEI
jgi:hypothetical protein